MLSHEKTNNTLQKRRKYTKTPVGAKAGVRPHSALARGGSPAAHGKRSIFPERGMDQSLQFIRIFIVRNTFVPASSNLPQIRIEYQNKKRHLCRFLIS